MKIILRTLSLLSVVIVALPDLVLAQVSNCVVFPSPNSHPLVRSPCWGRLDWMSRHEHENAPEQCNHYDGYITMFEDDFNGSDIDLKKWSFAPDYRNYGIDNNHFVTSNSPNFQLSNGVLTLKAINQGILTRFNYTMFRDNCVTKDTSVSYYYTDAGMETYKLYPTGKYEIRCKANYISGHQEHVNIAPLWLWMPSFDNFYNEIDIELWDKGRGENEINSDHWTYLARPPAPHESDPASNCMDGNTNHCTARSLYNAWHTFDIEWDSHKIKWSVDGNHFRSIYRTYNLAGIPINECVGPAFTGFKRREDMLPTYTNMRILSGLHATDDGLISDAQEYSVEIDYIRAFKKIDCSSTIHISEFKPFLNNGIPPTYGSNVQTPQVLTAGTITVAGGNEHVTINRGNFWDPSHLDLYASTSITLLPGFLADPAGNFSNYACPGDFVMALYTDNTVKFGDGFLAEAVTCPTSGGGNMVEEDNNADILSEKEKNEMEFYEIPANDAVENAPSLKEEIIAGVEQDELSLPNLEVYPNPVKAGNMIYFIYSIPQDGYVEITITDLSGLKIATVESGQKKPATYSLSFANTFLSPGVYIANLIFNGHSTLQRIVIT